MPERTLLYSALNPPGCQSQYLIANKFNLVSREEFEIQKKITEKLQKNLVKLKIQKTKKKSTKAKKS